MFGIDTGVIPRGGRKRKPYSIFTTLNVNRLTVVVAFLEEPRRLNLLARKCTGFREAKANSKDKDEIILTYVDAWRYSEK